MVRVQHDRQFRPDTNATFGEDGTKAAASFVPKLGRLGRVGRLGADFYPTDFVSAPTEGPTEPFYSPPADYVTITTEEQAVVTAAVEERAAKKMSSTTMLLIAGGGLLTLGLVAFLVARSE